MPLLMSILLILTAGAQVMAQPRIIDIRDHARLLRIMGRDGGDQLGISIKTADMNQDGFEDLLISSNDALDVEENDRVGRVDIFDSTILPLTGAIDMEDPQPPPMLTVYGIDDNRFFGYQIQVGDFDGDGRNDLVVSAPYMEDDTGEEVGYVYLFLNPTLHSFPQPLTAARADSVMIGYGKDERIGIRLGSADLNGDGMEEILIGAPNSRNPGPDEAGALYVVSGRSPAAWLSAQRLEFSKAVADATASIQSGVRAFWGAIEKDRLGESLAAGDHNGDGRPDLFIGVDHQDVRVGPNENHLDVGAVHLIDGTYFYGQFHICKINEHAHLVYRGRSEFDLYGDFFKLINWDQDQGGYLNRGTDDFWVSAPFAEPTPAATPDEETDDRGLISMIPGSLLILPPTSTVTQSYPQGVQRLLHGPLVNDNESLFGGDMAFGDVVDDATREMIVGASRYNDDDRGDNVGLAYILTRGEIESSSLANPLDMETIKQSVRILGDDSFDRFGFRIEILHHPVNGNSLVVSAPHASSDNDNSAGVVYILRPKEMVYTFNPLTPSPTYQPTITETEEPTKTPLPTHTITLTHSPSHTATPMPTVSGTPTRTSTPVPTMTPDFALDFNKDGLVDCNDLLMCSIKWAPAVKTEPQCDSHTLIGILAEILRKP